MNKHLTDKELLDKVTRIFHSEEFREKIENGKEEEMKPLLEGLDVVRHGTRPPEYEVEYGKKALEEILELNRKKLQEIKERRPRRYLHMNFPYLPDYDYVWARFTDVIASATNFAQPEKARYIETSDRVACLLEDGWEFNPVVLRKGRQIPKYITSGDTVLMRKMKSEYQDSNVQLGSPTKEECNERHRLGYADPLRDLRKEVHGKR